MAADGLILAELPVHHLAEYFGIWAVQEEPFRALVDHVDSIDLRAHVELELANLHAASPLAASQVVKPAERDGNVAVVNLSGPLMKYVSSLSGGTSTVKARHQIREAVRDPDVTAILLRIDSPGGTVAGTQDLGDDIAKASESKPVYAYIEDLGASAAYWAASQATKIIANTTAMVGSIGVFSVIQDMSGMAAQKGVKVHVVRAGTYKGAGVPGTQVTDEQLAESQRVINAINGEFTAAVAKGRKLDATAVAALNDGRVHLGTAAKSMGLIDAVGTFESVLTELRSLHSSPKKGPKMSTPEGTLLSVTPGPATLADLRDCCPGASNDFLIGQLGASATKDQAVKAFLKAQGDALAAANAKLADAEAKTAADAKAKADAEAAAAAKPGAKGLQPLKTAPGKGATASETSDFDALVAQEMRENKLSRREAITAMRKAHPELHKAFLESHQKASE